MFPVPYELALGAEATVETVSVPNIVEDSRYAASLDSKRAGEAREFLRGRAIGNGAARCGDIVGSGLGSGFLPLLPHLRYCQLLEVNFIDAAKDRLRILLFELPKSECRWS